MCRNGLLLLFVALTLLVGGLAQSHVHRGNHVSTRSLPTLRRLGDLVVITSPTLDRTTTPHMPTSLAADGAKCQLLFRSLREAFAKTQCDPRKCIPDMIALIRLARESGDGSVEESLTVSFFDPSVPATFRYVIPSLLVPMPLGDCSIRELILREGRAECIPVCGLIVALPHMGAQAQARWADAGFWLGYFVANRNAFGSEFLTTLDHEYYARGGGGAVLHTDLWFDYTFSTSIVPSGPVLELFLQGFKDEERAKPLQQVLHPRVFQKVDESLLRFVITVYRRAKEPGLAISAIKFLRFGDSHVVGPLFQDILGSESNHEVLRSVIDSEYVVTSSDSSVVAPLLDCYARHPDCFEISSLCHALARKDSSDAYAFLGGRLASAPEDVLRAMPCDLPEALAHRARALFELGARSSSAETRLMAYQAHIRAIPADRIAVLHSVAITETDRVFRQWVSENLELR